jgi:hydroxyacylglutathione hydrolase
VKHGDHLDVGNVRIDVLHTPGHTPEHLTFLVTDRAAADEPAGAVTGDFIFAGDVGRPDLLERAAKIAGTMEAAARQLWASLQAFKARPDWLQLWPGHGAGSACGKGISAMPHTTLGYERRFNWAFQVKTEDEFVRQVLEGQPEAPKYFAEMKRVNRDGPKRLGGFRAPARLDVAAFERLLGEGAFIVDTRPAVDYAVGHVPGTINIPMGGSFTTWAGWLMPYDADVYLLVDDQPGGIDAAVRDLALIGIDRIGGAFEAGVVDAWSDAGRPLGTIPQITADDLRSSLAHGRVTLIDVRGRNEWDSGHIEGARHIPLGYLPDRIDEIPTDKAVVVHCAVGGRSAIAASLLEARGVDRVVNLAGGYGAWLQSDAPVTSQT